jgi:hypothetical protein
LGRKRGYGDGDWKTTKRLIGTKEDESPEIVRIAGKKGVRVYPH